MNINNANNSHNPLSTQNNKKTIEDKTANTRLSARTFKLGTVAMSITSFLKSFLNRCKSIIQQKPITQLHFTLATDNVKPASDTLSSKALPIIKSSDLQCLLNYNNMLVLNELNPETYNQAKLDRKFQQTTEIIDKFIQNETSTANTDELANKLFPELQKSLELMKDTKALANEFNPDLSNTFKDKIITLISQKLDENKLYLALDEALDSLI